MLLGEVDEYEPLSRAAYYKAITKEKVKDLDVIKPVWWRGSLAYMRHPDPLVAGHSKILVYKNTIDDILGYVHSFDLFKNPKNIKSILRPVEYVPETMFAKDVLNVLIKKRKSLAVVLDEYGGTSGIMTVEDVIEELVGEIEDEHDTMELVEEQINSNTFLFSARLDVDHLNETYKFQIPESENYETLGGFIVNHTEEIPLKNQEINLGSFQFIIKEVSNTKIELVHFKII